MLQQKDMTVLAGLLYESLKEVREFLALTTFLARHRHPDQETCNLINKALDKSRSVINAYEAP